MSSWADPQFDPQGIGLRLVSAAAARISGHGSPPGQTDVWVVTLDSGPGNSTVTIRVCGVYRSVWAVDAWQIQELRRSRLRTTHPCGNQAHAFAHGACPPPGCRTGRENARALKLAERSVADPCTSRGHETCDWPENFPISAAAFE
jgi:hypothetical protein